VLVALLVVALLVATSIAVVEYVQLRAARERIEELEAAQGDEQGGGILDGFGDLFEDLLGEDGGGSGGLGGGLGAIECIGGLGLGGTGGGGGTGVDAIADRVEQIRELEFTEEPEPEFLSSEETSRRVQELFLKEYTPEIADIEERLLIALGAIPADSDLREMRARALGGQVAGFYEPETGELVVRQPGAEISVIDRITLAHELDHALTDQALDIPLPDDPTLGAEDANLAALALVEGDATVVMQRYSSSLGFEEQLELLDPEAIAEAEAGLSGLTPYLEQELLFPYEQGQTFVCDLYSDGGWDAVDRAYDQPPTTTAQVLFPDRYREGETAVDPRDPAAPGRGWRELAELQLGAANLLWLFSAPGGDRSASLDDPLVGAGAWAGGEITLWARGPASAVGISLAERAGSDILCSAVSHWYAASFRDATASGNATGRGLMLDGGRQDASLRCSADEVRLGIAPDVATASEMSR
jgi:hypothetical protein